MSAIPTDPIATAVATITEDVKTLIVQKANGTTVTIALITEVLPQIMVMVENISYLTGPGKLQVTIDSIVAALNQLDFPDKVLVIEGVETLLPAVINVIVTISKTGVAINVVKKAKSIFACFGKNSTAK